MSKRTITIVIEFEEDKPPSWIWDNHKMVMPLHGFHVKCIAEGDRLKESQDNQNDFS